MKKYEKEEIKSVLKHILLQICNDIETNRKVTIIFTLSCIYFGIGLIFNTAQFFIAMILFFIIVPILGLEICLRIKYSEYYNSEYYKNLKKGILFTYFTTGNLGEYETSLKLRSFDSKSKILFDLYIPIENGQTTQIDLVMINNYGIYVIESKNISGKIYGSEKDKYWTIIYDNNYKNVKYFNPILQNKKHTNAIIKLFPNIDVTFYEQYVVLSERCKLEKMNINNKYIHVVKRENLINNLLLRQKELKPKFSDNEVNMIYNELLRYCNVSKKIKKNHDLYLNNYIKI